MELQFSELQVLMDLGLTLVQAKVYLALVESGPSRTSAISKTSKVAQPDVYGTLSKLQQLGLVEKIIERPHKYSAIPVNEGISLLLEKKTEQYEKVRAEARILRDTLKTKVPSSTNKLEVTQFVLIPKGRHVIERINSAIAEAQMNMDLLLSWKRFSRGMVSTFVEAMDIAWAKNVKVRFIIERPSEGRTAKQLIQLCTEKPFCQLRFIPDYPKTVFGIYDQKEVFIIAESKTDLPDSPALWSNNQSLISVVQEYFEMIWLKAMKEPLRPPRKLRTS